MEKIGKKLVAGCMSVLFSVAFIAPAQAQQVTLDDLLKRVEAVEKKNSDLQQENASLKAEVQAMKDKQSAQEAQINDVQTKTAQVAAAPVAPAAGEGNPITSKLKLKVYGYVQAESVYSTGGAPTSSTGYSNVIAYTAPHQTVNKSVKDFKISGQNSRLGVSITGPDLAEGKTSGKVEIDFNNPSASSGAETYQPRLRLAYASLDYDKWGVTAGHNWDFFQPVKPDVINSSALWRAGDFGYRHPQIYLTNKWGEILGGKVTTQVGIIDSDDIYQETSGGPVVGAYASYATKVLSRDVTLSGGGIFGTTATTLINSSSVGKNNNDMYAGVADAQISFTNWLSLKASGFMGGNLANFMGGPYGSTVPGLINATGNLQNSKPLKTIGGFVQTTLKPTQKLQFNLGAGIDDTTNRDSITSDYTTIWSTNRTYFANVKYYLTKDLMVGVEYQYLHTNWLDGDESADNRIDTSVCYFF